MTGLFLAGTGEGTKTGADASRGLDEDDLPGLTGEGLGGGGGVLEDAMGDDTFELFWPCNFASRLRRICVWWNKSEFICG